jgi:hypothetical protein
LTARIYRAAAGLANDDEFKAEIVHFLQEIDTGNKGAIRDAIFYCICQERPIHGHIASHFFNSYSDVKGHKHKSWDDVFGRPIAKGAQLIALRRHRQLSISVELAVIERVAAGEPIDKNMFDAIAEELRADPMIARKLGNDRKKLKIGGTLVGKIYAKCKAEHSEEDRKRWKEMWGADWPHKNKDFCKL